MTSRGGHRAPRDPFTTATLESVSAVARRACGASACEIDIAAEPAEFDPADEILVAADPDRMVARIPGHGRSAGTITVTGPLGDRFGPEEQERLRIVARLAGVCLEIADQARHSERMRRFDEITGLTQGMALTFHDSDGILRVVADGIHSLIDCDTAVVVRIDGPDPARTATLVRAVGVHADLQAASPMDPLGRIVRLARSGSATRGAGTLSSQGALARVSGPWAVIPIGAPGEPRAALLLFRSPRSEPFTDQDVEYAVALAARTLFALRYTDLRRSREDRVVQQDRERIGRDLHDLIIQRIFAVGMLLESGLQRTGGEYVSAERAATAIEELNETIAELRRAIAGYEGDPPPAHPREVEETIRREVSLQGPRFASGPHVHVQLPEGFLLPHHLLLALNAAVREAVSNAARHSDADTVYVDIATGDGQLILQVLDNGTGSRLDASAGLGLGNLRRRAEELGGGCSLSRTSDQRTLFQWRVPAPNPVSGPHPPGA